MPHVQLLSTNLTPDRQELIDDIRGAFGGVPNMFQAVANSPAALRFMWAGFGALGAGQIDQKLGEQIAVAIANYNSCEYCLAAHTALGRKAGASAAEMKAAQIGESADPRTEAALRFVLQVVHSRAHVKEEDFRELRSAGFDDEATTELLAHVALNLFTNYVNVALAIPVDFPAVPLRTDSR